MKFSQKEFDRKKEWVKQASKKERNLHVYSEKRIPGKVDGAFQDLGRHVSASPDLVEGIEF